MKSRRELRCKDILKQLGKAKEGFQFFSDELIDVKEIKNFSIVRTLKTVAAQDLEILGNLIGYLNEEIRLSLKAELGLEQLRPFKEGLAAARGRSSVSSAWFFIDVHGNPISDEKFILVSDFEDGKAEVQKQGYKWYIDKTGKKVGPYF